VITRRTLLGLVAACLSSCAVASAQGTAAQPVVILGIPTEVKDIEARLSNPVVERVNGAPFSVGVIGSARIVLGKTNAGKVNAAMMASLAIHQYVPSAVFFTGTAGAIDPELKPGDVVIGTSLAYHDFGTSTARGFIRRPPTNPVSGGANPAAFAPDALLLASARRLVTGLRLTTAPGAAQAPVVREGLIVTGDTFVANAAQRDELRQALKASAVEMEGAAVAHVCAQLGVPFLVIRSITDTADAGTPDAYRTNIDAASRNAAMLTLAVIADLTERK
jgi:adenosylhomocysteine nucleosidase